MLKFKKQKHYHCLHRGRFNTEKVERVKKICDSMKLAIENGENFIIIEDSDTGSFIQFALFNTRKEILMDIPLIELSDEQIDDLKTLLNVEVACDSFTGEKISIQKLYFPYELRKASQIVEKILVQIFKIPENNEVSIEIFS